MYAICLSHPTSLTSDLRLVHRVQWYKKPIFIDPVEKSILSVVGIEPMTPACVGFCLATKPEMSP